MVHSHFNTGKDPYISLSFLFARGFQGLIFLGFSPTNQKSSRDTRKQKGRNWDLRGYKIEKENSESWEPQVGNDMFTHVFLFFFLGEQSTLQESQSDFFLRLKVFNFSQVRNVYYYITKAAKRWGGFTSLRVFIKPPPRKLSNMEKKKFISKFISRKFYPIEKIEKKMEGKMFVELKKFSAPSTNKSHSKYENKNRFFQPPLLKRLALQKIFKKAHPEWGFFPRKNLNKRKEIYLWKGFFIVPPVYLKEPLLTSPPI